MDSFLFHTPALLIAIVLLVLMLIANGSGFYLRQRQLRHDPDKLSEGLGPVEGSLLGLLALLLSFTFGISASKSDHRREIIVEEANAIGTAIMRCDLYPDSVRNDLRPMFKAYVDARITYYEAGIDKEKLDNSLQESQKYSDLIWERVTAFSHNKENVFPSQQMVPALNQMIDIVTTRDADRNAHVPESILWMLFLLTLAGSFVTGYGSKSRSFNWVIVIGFSIMTVMTIYLILDLDRPRRGIINMDQTHAKIVELKNMLADK